MDITEQTSKEYFKNMQTVHVSLLIGITLFTIISFFLNNNGQYSTDDGTLTEIFNIVILIMTACCVFASMMIHKRGLKKIKLMNNLSDKLKAYRSMFIKRFALLESPAFFGIVVFLLTANLYFLSYVILIIILFILFRPTKDKIVMELELDSKDRKLVDTPDTVVVYF